MSPNPDPRERIGMQWLLEAHRLWVGGTAITNLLRITRSRILESESPKEGYMGIKLFWRICSIVVFAITAPGVTVAQTKSPESDIRSFIGIWTAVHAETPIIVLHLRLEKGELVGEIQVCSYNVNSTGAVDVVTNPTLSKTVLINNIKIFTRSMSFDWKDADGDNDWN
jgi:hypothetical protein